MKEALNIKTYAYFRSTFDHMYFTYGKDVLVEMNKVYDLNALTDVTRRYILGFIDYMRNRDIVIIVPDDLNLNIDVTEHPLYFTEGANHLIKVLGSSSRVPILEGAIKEFLYYGVVINHILKAV